MSPAKKIILLVTGLLVLAAGVFAYFRISKLKAPARDPLDAVPSSAFCVIGADNPHEAWNTLNHGNLVWDALSVTDWAHEVAATAAETDSLLTADPEAAALTRDQPCWISLNCTGADRFDYFISFSLSTASAGDDAIAFLQKHAKENTSAEKTWKQVKIFCFGNKNGQWCAATEQGIVMISGNEELIKSSIDQLEKGATLKNDKTFAQLMDTRENSATANVFVNYERFEVAVKRLSNESAYERVENIARFASWSELDLSFRPNAVLLNGYTSAPDSAAGFLSVMKGQTPQRIEAAGVLPASTQNFTSFGISNFGLVMDRYDAFLAKEGHSDERRDHLAQLKRNYGYSPADNIGAWLGNEMVQAEIPSPGGGMVTIALFSAANTAQARSSLSSLELKNDTSATQPTADSSGYVIRKTPVPEMLSATFGPMFSDLAESYYTIINQFVVFAPDENSLRSVIAANINGTTLERNRSYAVFVTNISSEASITVYVSPSRCENTLRE
ncbi:MAG TPA: DUF3352 domain-containing protein, partial [Bacteroidia bacterium]|nr:DUF3352 domain-containing protein [Bacteroidia bacterium]